MNKTQELQLKMKEIIDSQLNENGGEIKYTPELKEVIEELKIKKNLENIEFQVMINGEEERERITNLFNAEMKWKKLNPEKDHFVFGEFIYEVDKLLEGMTKQQKDRARFKVNKDGKLALK